MNLVDEQDRALAEVFEVPAGFGEQFAHLLDAGRDRVERLEPALGVARDDVREGGFAAAGRAVKDERIEAVGEEHPAEQFARPEEVRLPDVLVQRAGAHLRRQRAGLQPVLVAQVVEQVHGGSSRGEDAPLMVTGWDRGSLCEVVSGRTPASR